MHRMTQFYLTFFKLLKKIYGQKLLFFLISGVWRFHQFSVALCYYHPIKILNALLALEGRNENIMCSSYSLSFLVTPGKLNEVDIHNIFKS